LRNLEEGPDIPDVTLVSGHEDRRRDQNLMSGERKIGGGRLQKSVENEARQGDKGVRPYTAVGVGFVGSSTVARWSSMWNVDCLDEYER
jgi:hypothetical protein